MFHVPQRVPAHFYNDYLWALRLGDVGKVRQLILLMSEQGLTADDVIRDVIAPAQREIGRAWGSAMLTIAEEHQATAIAEEALTLLLGPDEPASAAVRHGQVLLCSAQDEWHSIAARMVAVVWRHFGWNVRLVVPSVPAGDLAEVLAGSDVMLAGVTCAMSANVYGAWRTISTLRSRGVWVIAGGRGFGSGVWAERCARKLGADSYAADAAAGHSTLLHLRGLGSPGKRRGATLEGRGEEADRLMREGPRLVADCVELADGLRPGLLVDDDAARQARDDISLLFRSAVSAMLIDAPWIINQHTTWYHQLLLSSGADPTLGDLWVETLLLRLPQEARHLRALIESRESSDGDANA